MTDWQPIETAPKDGTDMLQWDGVLLWLARWEPGTDGRGLWSMASLDTRFKGPYRQQQFTHWHPLPEPPK